MAFIINIFQFHSKNEHKNKIKIDLNGTFANSDSIFNYLQISTLLNDL